MPAANASGRLADRLRVSYLQAVDAPSPKVFDYAPAPRWHQRHSLRRGILFTVLGGLGACLLWCAPTAWRQVEFAYWQSQCTRHSLPPTQVVYDESPAGSAALLATGAPYLNIAAAPSPLPRIAGYHPSAWDAVRSRSRLSGQWAIPQPPAAILFMHERTSKGGVRQLVVVEFGWMVISPAAGPDFYRQGNAVDLRGLFQTRPCSISSASVTTSDNYAGRNLRFYAGQIDPADPSHFTIRYERFGQAGVIDGYLEGKTLTNVRLQNRDPAASPWPLFLDR